MIDRARRGRDYIHVDKSLARRGGDGTMARRSGEVEWLDLDVPALAWMASQNNENDIPISHNTTLGRTMDPMPLDVILVLRVPDFLCHSYTFSKPSKKSQFIETPSGMLSMNMRAR
jgi:hypothetical protein